MSSCETKARRGWVKAGLMMVLLAGSGCIQRGAPIETPRGNPPPRALDPFSQQQVYQPPPAARYQAPQIGSRQLPQIGNNTPPPGYGAPYNDEYGSLNAIPDAPRPQPRPPQIVEQPLEVPRNPVTYEPPARRAGRDEPDDSQQVDRSEQPRASDDYATLLGDDGRTGNADDPDARASGDTPPAGVPGAKVLVALLVPETDRRGSVRALADGLAKAASLAAGDFDESRLILRKYDTGGDPRKAAEAAKNAIADGAKLIIGPLFSGSAAAVRPVAQSAGVSVIAFTTDESVLGGGLYSIGFLPQTEIKRIVSYAGAKGLRNVAILAPDSPYGGVIAREAQAAAGRNGVKIVRVQPFEEDFKALDVTATDFAEYYNSAPKVDGLLMATNGRTLQGLAAYLAYRDVLPTKIKFMGLGLWDDEETFREATLRGGWFPGVDPALKIDFGYRYGQAYGGEPPAIAFLGYDVVSVAATLLRESNSGNPFSQQAILSPSGFNGVSGLFRFRRDGRNDRALSILEVGNREFRVVDPAPSNFSQQVSSLVGG